MKKIILFACCILALAADDCKQPTKSSFNDQRKVPFFKVLVYENATGAYQTITIILFEDEAGNCYITSGTDGGITVAPKSACEKAKNPYLENK